MSLTDDISGKAKEMTGKATGDQQLEAEGKAQQIVGDIKDKADDTKDKIGDAVNQGLDAVRDKLNNDEDKDKK